MLTACRQAEITDLEWDEVNFKYRMLEISQIRYETSAPFHMSLVDSALVLLEREASKEHSGPFVFSAIGKDGHAPYSGWNKAGMLMAEKANALYTKAADSEEPLTYIRPNHDWRVTAATKLVGCTPELADRILGHLRPSMQRTNNKYADLDERDEAVEAWEEYLLGLHQRKTPKQIKAAQLHALWSSADARYWASEANIDPELRVEHREAN